LQGAGNRPCLFASCPRAWGQPSTSSRSTTTPEPAREAAKELAAEGQTIKHEQVKAAVGAAKEAKTEGKPPAEQKDAAKRPARLGQLERAKAPRSAEEIDHRLAHDARLLHRRS
jgi:hypothetical protein